MLFGEQGNIDEQIENLKDLKAKEEKNNENLTKLSSRYVDNKDEISPRYYLEKINYCLRNN